MNKLRDNTMLAILLTISSAVIYSIQYLVFHRASETVFYMLQDVAFVPIQVVIVTFVLNRFLNMIEKRKKTKKINVIISTFFVDAGSAIMVALSEFNRNQDELCGMIKMDEVGKSKDYHIKLVKKFTYDIYADPEKLESLLFIVAQNKAYMLSMLENSNLLEHDSFTDMLWAVFHVADELQSRGNLRNLMQEDINHLSNDILRAYSAMIVEWVNYITYLHDEYPFLYSAAIKKNLFCKD